MEHKFDGRTILIVEDEPFVALDIADGLKRAGADVATTNTLKKALVLVERADLSAAVLDHALSDGDSTRIRKRLKERHIPFVVYSGFNNLDDGDSDAPHINKPVTTDVVISMVDALLSRKPKID